MMSDLKKKGVVPQYADSFNFQDRESIPLFGGMASRMFYTLVSILASLID